MKHLRKLQTADPFSQYTQTGISGSYLDAASETLGNGDLTIHIRVDDPDYDVSATGEDEIAENTTSSSNRGPLKIYVSRGSETVVLATAGAEHRTRWCYHCNHNSSKGQRCNR